MKNILVYALSLWVSLLSVGSLSGQQTDIPVEDFFKDPLYRQVKISPDGSHLAVLVFVHGAMNLAVIDLANNQPLIITKEPEDISQYHWITNERIIYMTDSVTDDEYQRSGGIFAVDRDGKNSRVLVVPPLGQGGTTSVSNPVFTSYLGLHPEKDNLILVTKNARSRKFPDVYTIDVNNGKERRYALNEFNARSWFQDDNGDIRFAVQWEGTGESRIHFLNPETDEWEILSEIDDPTGDWSPLDFDPDKDSFLVQSNTNRDKTAIFRYFWKDTSRKPELIYENPDFDVSASPIYSLGEDARLVGIHYEAEKDRLIFFDDEAELLQKKIDAGLRRTFNRIISSDASGTKVLIRSNSDVLMPIYYLLDLERGNLQELTSVAPWLLQYRLPEKKPIKFFASDGVTVHGYLTLPTDFEEGNPVPLIVNPHGGPWARDSWAMNWYFDCEPKFFADRGFAVLQVNFRGSEGFGREFSNQSKQNIARMHQDVMDAIDWAIEEGYAHPDRLGVAGASWGGYQTMLCVTREAERFQFGINFFGVVDIPEQILTYLEWNREEAYDYWVNWFWDPKDGEGRKMLNEWSPINAIDKIQCPIFIYHGLRDVNVDIEQSRMLMSAMDRHDKPYVAQIDKSEMHSLDNQELRIETYAMIDEFLMPFREEWGLVRD